MEKVFTVKEVEEKYGNYELTYKGCPAAVAIGRKILILKRIKARYAESQALMDKYREKQAKEEAEQAKLEAARLLREAKAQLDVAISKEADFEMENENKVYDENFVICFVYPVDTPRYSGRIYDKKNPKKDPVATFEMLRFPEGSRCGIDNGRISKLYLYTEFTNYRNHCEYDRGWARKPRKQEQAFYEAIISRYN